MKVFRRFSLIVRGKTEKLLDRLEDPEEQLAVFVNELNAQMRDLQKAVARALADEKRLKMEIEDLMAQAAEWEKRAVLAVESGDDGLAREALLKKDELEARSLVLQKSWEEQKAATGKLKQSLRASKDRVAEAKRKYTLLLARYRSAETTKKVHESLSVRSDDSPMELMDKLSERIRVIEAETEAALEMGGETVDADLEARFATLEKAKRGGDALDQLKARLAEGHV